MITACEKHNGVFVYNGKCYHICPFCETEDKLESALEKISDLENED